MRIVGAVSLVLMLAALWGLTHRYHGFARDGELYAVQAMSRLQPALQGDIYLANTSQDKFTVFSPIYAQCIAAFGLQGAEMLLFVLCTIAFLAAAWALVRKLFSADEAWLSVAFIILVVGYYGAYQIFCYAENYLTARSLAEAMIVAALVCHYRGAKRLALIVAAAALAIHPLMALPGMLLLICLRVPWRVALAGAAAGILSALGFALFAVWAHAGGIATVIDPAWLEIVIERSQFLFLGYWNSTDWELFARPIVCLVLSALVIERPEVRRLCGAAVLVGIAGILVALIAGSIGPVALLLQGQAWRWVWVTAFVGALLAVPTAVRIWRNRECGPLCAVLLLMGWVFPEVDALACSEGALLLWLLRGYIDARSARWLRWTAALIGLVVLIWSCAHAWTYAFALPGETGREPLVVARIREFFGLGAPAALIAGALYYAVSRTRSMTGVALAMVFFLAVSVAVVPGSLRQLDPVGTASEIQAFADWRDQIPSASSVLTVQNRKSAAFIWFTLQRTSYMSVDQSSGVVFSRETALEVRRRGEILRPVVDPDWQLLTQINEEKAGKRKHNEQARPLTAQSLIGICADPRLGFVVARESLGFGALRHTRPGIWKDWNLYDCRAVRASSPRA